MKQDKHLEDFITRLRGIVGDEIYRTIFSIMELHRAHFFAMEQLFDIAKNMKNCEAEALVGEMLLSGLNMAIMETKKRLTMKEEIGLQINIELGGFGEDEPGSYQ